MVIKKTVYLGFFIFLSLALILSSLPFLSDTTYYAVGQNQYSFSLCKQNFTKLEPGDIVFKFPDVFPNFFPKIIDHCLLFVEFDNSTGLYVFIEANVPNEIVQYVYETESSLTNFPYGPVARVEDANNSQKLNAINFAKGQVGKSFQMEVINKNYNPEDVINDPYANEWYCSELMWAAYYNCNNSFPESEPQQGYVYGEGIELDRNGWNKTILNISIVAPREILLNKNKVSVFYLHNVTNSNEYHISNKIFMDVYQILYPRMYNLIT